MQLTELVHRAQGKFLLTYNDSPFIRELYRDCKIIRCDLPNSVIKLSKVERPPFSNIITQN